MPASNQAKRMYLKSFYVLTLSLFFAFTAHAQLGQLFYELIDDGSCNVGDGSNCAVFSTTCPTGWVVSNGSPQLMPTNGWSCSVPCSQGTANCDPIVNDAIFMVGLGDVGEGAFKPFYFQSGLTYRVCVFYSMVPQSPGSGGIGILTFAAKNGLSTIHTVLNSCQGPHAAVAPAELIGTAPSVNTFATLTFTPTTDYTQFLMYATSTGPQFNALVTAIEITVVPACATPAITSVSSPGPGQISVTWTSIPGVENYAFSLSDGTSVSQNGYGVNRGVIPTGPFPSTYSTTFMTYPIGHTYTLTVQGVGDATCPSGSTPVSPPSNPVTLTCLSATSVLTVVHVPTGILVVMQPVSGATNYTIDFYSGGTITQSFTSSTINGTYTVAPGTYTVGGHANAFCGSTPEVFWSTPVVVN